VSRAHKGASQPVTNNKGYQPINRNNPDFICSLRRTYVRTYGHLHMACNNTHSLSFSLILIAHTNYILYRIYDAFIFLHLLLRGFSLLTSSSPGQLRDKHSLAITFKFLYDIESIHAMQSQLPRVTINKLQYSLCLKHIMILTHMTVTEYFVFILSWTETESSLLRPFIGLL
jgi:hypothetical protein